MANVSITVQFGTKVYDVYCRKTALESLRQLSLPIPESFARANSVVNPRSFDPARAWLLMLRKDADEGFALGSTQRQVITLSDGDTTLRLQYFYALRYDVLTPGVLDDEQALCLVEFADVRQKYGMPHFTPFVNVSANVRKRHYEQGLYSGVSYVPWVEEWESVPTTTASFTWQTLLNYLTGTKGATTWTGTTLGTGLPWTPDGTPEGWRFPGVPQKEAVNAVLDKLGAGLACDLTEDSATRGSLVKIGETDSTFQTLRTNSINQNKLIWATESEYNGWNAVPGKVRTFFHKVTQRPGGEETLTTSAGGGQAYLDVSHFVETTTSGACNSALHHCQWDDLPAVCNQDGSLIAAATTACDTRAAERASDFIRVCRANLSQLHERYTGLIAFKPGSELTGVAWTQMDDGSLTTEIFSGYLPDEKGQWKRAAPASHATQAPFFGTTFPTAYPAQVEILALSSTTADGSGFVLGSIVRTNTGSADSSPGSCYLYGLGTGTLTGHSTNEKYVGRLVGTYNGTSGWLPVYRVDYPLLAAAGVNGLVSSAAQYMSNTHKRALSLGVGASDGSKGAGFVCNTNGTVTVVEISSATALSATLGDIECDNVDGVTGDFSTSVTSASGSFTNLGASNITTGTLTITGGLTLPALTVTSATGGTGIITVAGTGGINVTASGDVNVSGGGDVLVSAGGAISVSGGGGINVSGAGAFQSAGVPGATQTVVFDFSTAAVYTVVIERGIVMSIT